MTTIVYDHKNKQIAVDGSESCGNEIKTLSAVKHYESKSDHALFFIAGNVCDVDEFLAEPKVTGRKTNRPLDCTAIFVTGNDVYKGRFDEDIGWWNVKLEYSDSIGTGGVYALCGVDLGLSAKAAVEYASKKDVYTGGTIKVYDVIKGEFIE